MTQYFTAEQFQLLDKWKGEKRDESPEQDLAYEKLTEAYGITEEWAKQVQAKLFPAGQVTARKRPTNQGNNFAAYNWAKIYPSADSPRELAYTVGISAEDGFVVKIDTVGLKEAASARQTYLKLRDSSGDDSAIVGKLSAAEGLSKNMEQLTDWSIQQINSFKPGYDEIAKQLKLDQVRTDEDLLKHFDGKPAFQTFRASWTLEDAAAFCRFARAIHRAGLDWWHVDIGIQLRFGKKNPGEGRAEGVLGYVDGTRKRMVDWSSAGSSVLGLKRFQLTEDAVAKAEATLLSKRSNIEAWLNRGTGRPGTWPDALSDERDDRQPETDEIEVTAMSATNRIYYGPPGTGKTYELSKILKGRYEQAGTTVSGDEWRNRYIAEKISVLPWWQGVVATLYALGEKATVSQLMDHPFIKGLSTYKGRTTNIRQSVWTTLQERTVDGSTTVKQKLRFSPQVFDKDSKSVWHLSGDWREACEDVVGLVDTFNSGQVDADPVQRHSFVTFHQSYGYEDFVEGLRPVLGSESETRDVQYEIRSGIFKELCRRARSVPGQRFAMVIDEINRGNISRIFGELITLIEQDKREGAENAISVILPYSGERFSVPANVDIIGTMNTADRSLALLDTALRRRFEFIPVMPNVSDESGAPLAGLRVSQGDQVINIPRMLDLINRRIEALYDRDHCIGHAYFTALSKVSDGEERFVALQQIFKTKILPLLEEYFFEDWQKIRLVLADNQKPSSARFITECQAGEDDMSQLFGERNGLSARSTKQRYMVNEPAFFNPESYIGIYPSSGS